MILGKERTIFHIDVNSAFLAWEAVSRVKKGEPDLREIPAVVGGNQENRKGIVLARSIPAKEYGIKTAETIYSARKKCPQLVVVPPSFSLYEKSSQDLLRIIKEYSPVIEQYSIDEFFLDYTDLQLVYGTPLEAALLIKERIKEQLGFTVNIGVANNKLLAKMASDFLKPDRIHTLYSEEIKDKMWPLPVGNLFMVGRATAEKLKSIGIETIGDLAKSNRGFMRERLKKHGELIWDYANGIDSSLVEGSSYDEIKSISNETTISRDVTCEEDAYLILIALAEKVSSRLRAVDKFYQSITVTVKNSHFQRYSKQKKLDQPLNSTQTTISLAKEIFRETWRGDSIRLLGITLGDLSNSQAIQLGLWDEQENQKQKDLDQAVDKIRAKFGFHSLVRGRNIGYND